MSDMRDDLDELGRRLWPTTDALRPADRTAASGQPRTARRLWRFEPLVTLAAAVLLVGVIGGAVLLGRSLSSPRPIAAGPSSSAPSVTVGPTTPSPTTPSPSATAIPAPHIIVWTFGQPGQTVIQSGTVSGGFQTLAVIGASSHAIVLGAGGHRVLYWTQTDGHLYDVDINTKTVTDHGGGAGDSFYGAAFSPDGDEVEYLRQTAPNTGQIRLLTFGTGVITGLQSFSAGPLDVPRVWSAGGIAATREWIPKTDTSSAGFAILDPSTGAPIATTSSSVDSWAIASDGVHAAEVVSTAPASGINPHQLATVVIGSPPRGVIDENVNHFLQVQGVSPDGSTVLFTDEPTMGGFAGITLSPDYGLFTLTAGHRAQVAHYGGGNGGYVGSAYLNGTDFVVVAETAGPTADQSTCTLMESIGGGQLTPLVNGAGTACSAYVVTG